MVGVLLEMEGGGSMDSLGAGSDPRRRRRMEALESAVVEEVLVAVSLDSLDWRRWWVGDVVSGDDMIV